MDLCNNIGSIRIALLAITIVVILVNFAMIFQNRRAFKIWKELHACLKAQIELHRTEVEIGEGDTSTEFALARLAKHIDAAEGTNG